jgi:hypothetical protein
LQKTHVRYRGVALLWTAAVMLVLILIVGLALDTAKVLFTTHQLQNAADAAALAGAQFVKGDPGEARIKAYEYAYANYYTDADSVILDENLSNAEDGDIVLGVYYHQFDTFVPVGEGEFANAIKVVARCTTASLNPPAALHFGPLADVHEAYVSCYAIAVSSGGTGAGLITLGCGDPQDPNSQSGTGLDIAGGSVIDVSGGEVEGEIQVNCASCDHPHPAVSGGGAQADIEAAQINVVGCYGGPEVDVPIAEGADYMPDPLGCYPNYDCLMPPPPYVEANDLSPAPGEYWVPDPCVPLNVLSPGYYSGGINITSATTNVYFEPGIYVVDGEILDNVNAKGRLNLTGGTIDAGDGAMFYILGGSVDIGGGAQLNLTELVPWEDDSILLPYEGMLIYQDPLNITPARIIGTSDLVMVGTIYFPFNHVEVGGGGYALGTQLIAESMRIHTNPNEGVLVNYDGRYRAPGGKSYLVR